MQIGEGSTCSNGIIYHVNWLGTILSLFTVYWYKLSTMNRNRLDFGVVHSDFGEMACLANEYFQGIYSAVPSLDASLVLDLLEARVAEANNE